MLYKLFSFANKKARNIRGDSPPIDKRYAIIYNVLKQYQKSAGADTMEKSKKEKIGIIILVVICCIAMALVETIIEPAYFVKSAAKVIVFSVLPLIVMKLLKIKLFDDNIRLNKEDVLKLLLLGAAIYGVIIGAFFITRKFFDYSELVRSLSEDQNVDSRSFIWVALYISFGNSFLEEFLFRFIAFIKLSEYIPKKFAYIFSSVLFAVYHIAMIGPSFPPPLLLLALFGLTVGGFIFDLVDGKNKNIYNSWIIHMFADFAIMTIWFIYI